MQLRLTPLPQLFAVCRLPPGDPIPTWARGAFVSITRTSEELSIVCEEGEVPEEVTAERAWRCLKIEGPIPFEMTGVAAAVVAPLAMAHISVFLVATYDTDYLLVKAATFEQAVDVLSRAGHDAG